MLVAHAKAVYADFCLLQLQDINTSRTSWHQSPLLVLPPRMEANLWELGAYRSGRQRLRWAPIPYRLLGAGAYRIAVALCPEHVLKINPSPLINHNLRERQVWRSAPSSLKDMLIPILLAHRSPMPSWLLTARARPLLATLSPALRKRYRLLKKIFSDLHEDNLGWSHSRLVALDYGDPAKSLSHILQDAHRVLG